MSQIDFGDMHREELKVVFPETRQTTYRVVIDNRDSPPRKIDGVRAEGTVYELVAFAGPTSDYSLAYANDKAPSHHHDIAALNTLLTAGNRPVSATLGAERPNPTASEPRPTNWREFLLGIVNNPVLLIGLVVILVMALGWGLYHAARRVDSLPKDSES